MLTETKQGRRGASLKTKSLRGLGGRENGKESLLRGRESARSDLREEEAAAAVGDGRRVGKAGGEGTRAESLRDRMEEGRRLRQVTGKEGWALQSRGRREGGEGAAGAEGSLARRCWPSEPPRCLR